MSSSHRSPDPRPSAIVLCSVLTGLATTKSLATQGVKVHAIVFDEQDPLRASTSPQRVVCLKPDIAESALIDYICQYAAKLGDRPALLATSDAHALILAKHADQLRPFVRHWATSYDTLRAIVHKDQLYTLAEAAGVPILPWVSCQDLDQVKAWSEHTPGPYLIKPHYAGTAEAVITEKNRVFQDRSALIGYLASLPSGKGMLVQRLVLGGDGEIYDTYGLCDRHGKIVSIATHRRLLQHPPNFGTTCFGEIPANIGQGDQVMIDKTAKLLAQMSYHGIFGIEWLRDQETGRFNLIDFNARPFSSIGHLRDCGFNLPLLGYRSLIEDDLSNEPLRPPVKHLYWVDFYRFCLHLHQSNRFERGIAAPLGKILSTRSFAYWDWRDPYPALRKLLELLKRGIRLTTK